jgi:hypothetical protein
MGPLIGIYTKDVFGYFEIDSNNVKRPFRMTVLAATFVVLLTGIPLHAQTVSPYRAVSPIMRGSNQNYAPSSVNQSDLGADPSPARPGQTQLAEPAIVTSRVDACLAASKLTVLGTIDGIKGTLYVTNVSSLPVTPLAQFVVCDTRGVKVGLASKTGTALGAGADEKIEFVATNLNAADLKLLKLTTAQSK